MWVGTHYRDLYCLMGGHGWSSILFKTPERLLEYIGNLPWMPDRDEDKILENILGYKSFWISTGGFNKDGTLQVIDFKYKGEKVTK